MQAQKRRAFNEHTGEGWPNHNEEKNIWRRYTQVRRFLKPLGSAETDPYECLAVLVGQFLKQPTHPQGRRTRVVMCGSQESTRQRLVPEA